jgi:transposase InsO family protein
MKYPLVTDLAHEGIPVAVTCRVLKFSKQGYYKWKAKPISDRDLSDAYLINAALDAHHDDPTFGYRFIADELELQGFVASENRVQRLCSMQRIWSLHAKKRGLNRKPGPPVHDDLVERDFTAAAANVLWLTDITEHPTGEGKLYLCAIKDVFSNRIVGYSMDARMPAALAVAALNNALVTRDVAFTIVHSDRGSQFRSNAFVRALHRAELRGSMGRVATCADNAAMESFFSLLQKNVLDTQRWKTREELRLAIVTWIERTYNRRRRQRVLGRLTPVEYETIYSVATAA